jgi:hypothetical protein
MIRRRSPSVKRRDASPALRAVPAERKAKIVEASVTWNYTTVLNIIFLAVDAVLVWRFVRTDGLPMLRMMDKPMRSGRLMRNPRVTCHHT